MLTASSIVHNSAVAARLVKRYTGGRLGATEPDVEPVSEAQSQLLAAARDLFHGVGTAEFINGQLYEGEFQV